MAKNGGHIKPGNTVVALAVKLYHYRLDPVERTAKNLIRLGRFSG